MNDNGALLHSLAARLDLPQPARARVVIEVAADLADLEALYIERGLGSEEARELALERLDLSDEAIRELVRVHGSPIRRGLDRFSERSRRRGEQLALAALLIFLIGGTRALVPTRTLLTDAGPGLWVIAAIAIPGILLAATTAYSLWGRDAHDSRRLRAGLDLILVTAGAAAAAGLALWWFGLRRIATASASQPETALVFLVEGLTRGSALVVAGFQASVALGILWFILSSRTAQVERGEAELILLAERDRTKEGVR